MRFVIDMNLSPAWVPCFQAAGYEAVHWSKVGAFDAPDAAVMEWAVANDAVVVTSDLDFSAILAATRGCDPSVVQIRGDLLTPASIGAIVVQAIPQFREDLTAGAVLSIDLSRARVRVLPLQR